MENFLKKIGGGKLIIIFLFDVVTPKSTYISVTRETETFRSYWEFQDPNAELIVSIADLRCKICLFLYNSSNPALCVDPCSPLDATASLPDCSVAKNEADSWEDIDGYLYTYHTKNRLSWNDAIAKCAELGMHLVSVETIMELNELVVKFEIAVPDEADDIWLEIKDPDNIRWMGYGHDFAGRFKNDGKDCVNYDDGSNPSMSTLSCVPMAKTFICERAEPCLE